MSHSQQQDDNDLKSIPRKAIASYESKYKYLSIRKILPEGIALVTINREEQLNALNLVGHWELKEIFVDLDQDDEVKVIVVTGKGKAFCAGGDLEMTLRMTKDEVYMRQVETDARAIVNNVLNCTKVVISAINGICVGAGTVVALMADISVTYADCVIKDGHINLGVAAGDHACFSWPLNVGLAKSKYYLLLDEPIKGAEAERIGLVSKVVEKDNVLSFSLEIAKKLCARAQQPIRRTKYALNQYIRMNSIVSGDLSLSYEMFNFKEKDVLEGIRAIKEKRTAKY